MEGISLRKQPFSPCSTHVTRLRILGLQPHGKAAMLGVKTVEFFSQRIITRLLCCQLQTTSQFQNCPFAICISPIIHLVCFPKLFIIFVFNFSWVLQRPQEKKKAMLMQNYGGQTRCIMRDMQTTNCCLCANPKHPTFTKISKVSESCQGWTFVHLNKIVHSRKLTFTEMLTSWRSKIRRISFLHCTSPQNVSPKIMTWE